MTTNDGPDRRTTEEFDAALRRGDHEEAVRIITTTSAAGREDLAAALLVRAVSGNASIAVTQVTHTVEAGATHIGVRLDNFGRRQP